MKERIVIKDEFWVKHFQEREKDFYEEDMCSGGNPEEWWHYEKEQVPENFADLLTLCKDTKGCFVLRASDREYIEVPTDLIGYSFTFYQDGQIFADEDVCVKEKATPQQMWQIIKNLIGEE